jgi:Zn-dependent protease
MEPEQQQRSRQRPAPAAAGAGWSIRVGTVLGIPIRIHFTFVLLLFWFGAVSADQGQGFLGGVVFLLLLFGCVVLHELGHAAMARRFGVRTREIVLYPIGGVARLEEMPSGKAELLIALAGPAVNFLLAAPLAVLLWMQADGSAGRLLEIAREAPLLLQLLSVNLVLGLFNLLPAFPMDGGRVLRAALSLAIGEERATSIAATIGQGLAILLAIYSVVSTPFKPFPLLIAIFVFLGAGQEVAFQRNRSAVRGLLAKAAMVTRFETLAPNDPLSRAAELLLATHQADFPVIDAWGRVAGLLHRSALLAGLARENGRDMPVLEFMDRQPIGVAPETPLEEIFRLLQGRPLGPILVISEAGLQGMITLENFGELIEVSQSLKKSGGG